MNKKKEKNLRPMSEHPEAEMVVSFYYRDKRGELSGYRALWTGKEWLCRKPYTIDEWEEMPDFDIVGWDDPISHQELLNRTLGK